MYKGMEIEDSKFGGFAWRTTFHGLHYVCWYYAKCRRVTWLLLWLATFGLFVFQAVNYISFYLSYPTGTEVIHIQEKKMSMNTLVTLCNMNPLSLARLSEENLYDPLNSLLNTGKVSDTSSLLNQISSRQFWKTMSQAKEDFLLSCSWKGKPCPSGSWSFSGSIHGACYTFNPPKERQSLSGLSLSLNLATYDVVPTLAEDQGIKVYLHTEDRYPLRELRTPDFYITSGFHTHVFVKTTELMRLPQPYNLCSGNEDQSCLTKCLSNHVLHRCGCVPYYMQTSGTIEIGDTCNTTASIFCTVNINTGSDIGCDCPPQCTDTTFEVLVTQTKLHDAKILRTQSNSTSDILLQQYMKSEAAARKEQAPALEDLKLRDNIAQLTFTGNHVVCQRDYVSYGLQQLLKDIAVAALIFMGASILSLFEIIDLLFELCYKCLCKK